MSQNNDNKQGLHQNVSNLRSSSKRHAESVPNIEPSHLTLTKRVDPIFNEYQEEKRMQVRMHIIEESRAEYSEMPQEWIEC